MLGARRGLFSSRSVLVVLVALLAPAALAAEPPAAAPPAAPEPQRPGAWRVIGDDFARFYASPRRLSRLGAGFLAAGLVANSSADESVRDWYAPELVGAGSDDVVAAVEGIGEFEVVVPAFLAAALAVGIAPDPAREPSRLSEWIRRSARGYLVGGPTLYYLQQLTGGSRPGEPAGSAWDPFHGNHGVSGHGFVGAVPFLTMARMTDNRAAKAVAIAASTLSSLGRLREDKHYFSQVALGWLLAWEVTGAVADGEGAARPVAVAPLPYRDGGGLLVAWRF